MQAYQDEPELLLGGLFLAYGMPDAAENLFQQVLQRSAAPQVHDRAWLQLAKTRHKRGQPVAATSALEEIGQSLADDETAERQVLQALLDLQQNNYPQAQRVLSELPENSEWSSYGRYNQAIALLRMKQTDAGLKLLATIGSSKADNEEAKSLRDRANLVRGFLLLEAQQPAQARHALEQVRLSSLAANQALLGVGWAALQQDDPQGALAPWQVLADRESHDPAVLEATLAIPYALSQLEADEQSLQQYRLGIQRFDNELLRVDQAITAVQRGELLSTLDSHLSGKQTPHPLLALLPLLPLLLSENTFQERYQDYRDLVFLQANLLEWQEKIGSYQAMLTVRQAAFKQRLAKVEEKLAGTELHQLKAERERLQALIEQARSPSEPAFLLADHKEKRLLQRLDKIQNLLSEFGEQLDLHNQREQAELLKGILIWNTSTEHPVRIWEAGRQLQDLNQSIQDAESSQAALQVAHSRTEGRFGGFEQQIESLEGQIPALLSKVNLTRIEQGRQLQQMAIEGLEGRKALLNNYLIQARLGVASLLDRNSQHDRGAE